MPVLSILFMLFSSSFSSFINAYFPASASASPPTTDGRIWSVIPCLRSLMIILFCTYLNIQILSRICTSSSFPSFLPPLSLPFPTSWSLSPLAHPPPYLFTPLPPSPHPALTPSYGWMSHPRASEHQGSFIMALHTNTRQSIFASHPPYLA